MKIVTVNDIKGGHHYPIQCYKTVTDALRAFQTACEDQNSIFNKFPMDFVLLELGEFDEISGEIIPNNRRILANASEYVVAKFQTQLPLNEAESRN